MFCKTINIESTWYKISGIWPLIYIYNDTVWHLYSALGATPASVLSPSYKCWEVVNMEYFSQLQGYFYNFILTVIVSSFVYLWGFLEFSFVWVLVGTVVMMMESVARRKRLCVFHLQQWVLVTIRFILFGQSVIRCYDQMNTSSFKIGISTSVASNKFPRNICGVLAQFFSWVAIPSL